MLLVTIDTLRADHLGSYGFPLDSSPSLDALAGRAVVFERAIAAAPATGPSHASILTSRYVREHAVGFSNGATRLADETTLAERFQNAGWKTAAFVSNAVLHPRMGLDRGFDVYDARLPSREPVRAIAERRAEATTAGALGWLAAAGDAPVFLWVHYQDPHGPYTPPAPLEQRFHIPPAPGEQPLPLLEDDSGLGGIPAYQAIEGLSRVSEYRERYVGEIFHVDRHLGRLLDAFASRSSGRGGIVLVTADHGESFGENDRWLVHFHTTTPELAHVPMILSGPGIAPGRREELVSHVDVMPTLLELAGLPPEPDASGTALGPYLRTGRPLPQRTVYCDIGRELSAYRGDGFLRVRGARGAWGVPPHPDDPPQPVWQRYRWGQHGRFERLGREVDVDPETRRYLARAVPMRPARLGAQTRQALRAMGYAEE